MFAQLGTPTYGVRACAACRDDKEQLSRIVHELIFLNMIMTVLSYVALGVMIFSIPKLIEERTIILISGIGILLNTIGVEWFYQAIEQYDYITFRNITFKILSIILMFLFVKTSDDYIIYAAINVVGTVGSNVMNMLRLRKYIILKPLNGYNFKRHLKPLVAFFSFSVATKVYTSLDTVMLGFMDTDSEVGYYNAAIKIKNILVSSVTALGTVLLPRATYYVENGMNEEFKRIIKKSFQFVIAVAVPFSVYFIVEARNTILLLAGESYIGAITSMMIITPTIFFIGLSNITGVQILIPLGLEKYTVISTIVGAVVDLLINIVAIPRFGAAGAAFGTLIAELVVLLVQVIELHRLGKGMYLTIDLKNCGKCGIAIVAALVCMIIVESLVHVEGYFLKLLVSAITFFGIYVGLLLVMKEEIVISVIRGIKK
jgi:O-antigen/teichoic acid export membrane protein